MDKPAISIPVTAWREGDQVILWSPALDIATQGNDIEHAKKNFEEALDLWLETVLDENMLDETLLALGWERQETTESWLPHCAPIEGGLSFPMHLPQ